MVTLRHEPTELEKDLIRKAKEMSINPKEGENPTGDESKLFEDPDFIKEVLKDLNLDPESSEAKEMIDNMSKQKNDASKPGDSDASKKNKMDEEKKE
jgi:hypothetical protein